MLGHVEAAAALSHRASARPATRTRRPAPAATRSWPGCSARLRAAVGGHAEPPRMLQAPVSFRVAGPVLAQVLRAVDALAAAVEPRAGRGHRLARVPRRRVRRHRRLRRHRPGRALRPLTAALAHAAEVGAARLHRLLDPRVTGLPAQLAPRPGPDAGLVAVHKRAAGEVHALRRLAVRDRGRPIETSGGQEDVQSFAWEAAETLRGALRHARAVTACELLAAYQAARSPPAGRPVPAGCRGRWTGAGQDLVAAGRPARLERITADRHLRRRHRAPRGRPGPRRQARFTSGGICLSGCIMLLEYQDLPRTRIGGRVLSQLRP